jgi:hypothetical protein
MALHLENVAWVGCILVIIILSNIYTHRLGQWFYEHNDSQGKVFDILHEITPDLHDYKAYNDIIATATMISFLFVPNSLAIVKEFAGKFLLIMLVRALTIISTILPKHDKCPSELKWYHYLKGQCYDKIFSGHTALVLLATLIYLREGILSFPVFLAINFANWASIILTRSHYTIDIILAIVITLLVYDGDYHIFTDFMKKIKV